MTAISAKIIDVCNSEESHGMIIFWPYYIQPIDFDNLTDLPEEYNIHGTHFECKGSHSYTLPNANASILDARYVSDTTLTISNSPYYVVQKVRILEGATMRIENGVEIIFIANDRITEDILMLDVMKLIQVVTHSVV